MFEYEIREKHPYHRNFLRFDIPVRVELLRIGKAVETRTLNIGRGGMCIDSGEVHKPNDEVNVQLYISGDISETPIQISGRVIWCEKIGKEKFRTGISFDKLGDDDFDRFHQWLIRTTSDVYPRGIII